jgi:hypothetical protein
VDTALVCEWRLPFIHARAPASITGRKARGVGPIGTESAASTLTLRPGKRRETEARMGILWIILVVVVVLALLGFVGRAL